MKHKVEGLWIQHGLSIKALMPLRETLPSEIFDCFIVVNSVNSKKVLIEWVCLRFLDMFIIFYSVLIGCLLLQRNLNLSFHKRYEPQMNWTHRKLLVKCSLKPVSIFNPRFFDLFSFLHIHPLQHKQQVVHTCIIIICLQIDSILHKIQRPKPLECPQYRLICLE